MDGRNGGGKEELLPSPAISWLAQKTPDMHRIAQMLVESVRLNHFANAGPCASLLEREAKTLLGIGRGRAVVATSNGASALHAIIAAIDLRAGRRLRYATQAYTFPSVGQGPLADAGRLAIVDVDPRTGALDLDALARSGEEVDGIVVTNVLGNVADLSRYEEWAERTGGVVIYDDAATPLTRYGGRSALDMGVGAAISLHHTKPIGFGEGGLAVVDADLEPFVRRAVNFGYDLVRGDQRWDPLGDNRKMSDVAAAFALSYMRENVRRISEHHMMLYCEWRRSIEDDSEGGPPAVSLFPNFSDGEPVAACIPVLFRGPVDMASFRDMCVRKYYKPLVDRESGIAPNAWSIYDRVACFPCNLDIGVADVRRMALRALAVGREIGAKSSAVLDDAAVAKRI
jgi:dTDP-4-amino-4,6-dideoxygalactose transaminase